MELRQLRYFQAVVEAGSLSAAAAKLHISQPPLSVQISKLEAELGVSLLTRNPRGVEATAAGRYLLEASSRLLADADEIVQTISRIGSGLQGVVRLAAVPVLMWRRIPDLLAHFSVTNPDTEIQLTSTPPWIAIDLLAKHRVDVALIMVTSPASFIARYQDSFECMDWGPAPLVATLPPNRTDTPDPLPLEALAESALIMPPRVPATPSLTDAVDTFLREYAVVPASFRQVETISSGIPLIEAGLAVGILPDPGGNSLSRFNVVTRLLTPSPEPLRTLVLVRREREPEPALRALVEQMRGLTLPESSHPHDHLA